MTNDDIQALVARWKEKLNLHRWHIMVYIDNNMPSHGVTQAQWQYLSAKIHLNPVLTEADGYAIEEIVVHELVHVLLSALWLEDAELTDHEVALHERTTEEVSVLLLDIVGSLK